MKICDLLGLPAELTANGQEGGDRAGHVRSCHARAAVLDVDGPALFLVDLRQRAARPHDVMRSPGATRSGLARPSPVGPLEEK